MAYKFQESTTTRKSVRQVAEVVKEVGEDKSYMGVLRRAGVSLNTQFGNGEYGPFSPNADDDPFAGAGRQPDFKVGWYWGNSVDNGYVTMRQGWRVIFEIYDNGTNRAVEAKVQGMSQKGEVAKFVKSVFRLL